MVAFAEVRVCVWPERVAVCFGCRGLAVCLAIWARRVTRIGGGNCPPKELARDVKLFEGGVDWSARKGSRLPDPDSVSFPQEAVRHGR
jgi:hypothetical protein